MEHPQDSAPEARSGLTSRGSIELTPEQAAEATNAATEHASRTGYPLKKYRAILQEVVKTGVPLGHLELEFAGVSTKHIAYVLKKQAAELQLPVNVAELEELGVCVTRATLTDDEGEADDGRLTTDDGMPLLVGPRGGVAADAVEDDDPAEIDE